MQVYSVKAVTFLLLNFCQMFLKHGSPIFLLTFCIRPLLPGEIHIHCEVVIVLIILCACFNTAVLDIKSAEWYWKVLTAEMSADVKATCFKHIVSRHIAR
jgi:hypothetical protein